MDYKKKLGGNNMKNTRILMMDVIGEVASIKMSDIEIVNTLSEDAQIAKIFVDNFAMIQNLSNKYFSIDDDTKISTALECISKVVKKFDITKGARISSLVYTYFENALALIVRDALADKRRANNNADSLNAEEVQDRLKASSKCDDTSSLEIMDLIENSNFNTNEIKYITAIIADTNILDAEIARDLNMTRAGVNYTKKSIRTKLAKLGYRNA